MDIYFFEEVVINGIKQIGYNMNGIQIYSEETKQESVEKIEKLMQLSSRFYGYTPKQLKKLVNYSLEESKLNVRNFGSFNSEDGMRLGFSAYERLNYLDEIKDVQNLETKSKQKLGDIEISQEERLLLSEYPFMNIGSISQPNTLNNYKSEVLYNIYTNYYISKEEQDFSEELKDEELGKVLDDINYLAEKMNEDNYPRTIIEPREYLSSNNVDAVRDSNIKLLSNMEPSLITDRIDEDDPVVISISNKTGGHALLAYAYEKLSDDLILVYVSDSNFPLYENEDEYKVYNKDVKITCICY